MTNRKPLSLHVPEPGSVPATQPDFSAMKIPEAGTVRRPDPDSPDHEIRDLAYALIRVLDDKGQARRPVESEARCRNAAPRRCAHMMLTRAYDDRMYRAQRQGKTSFYMKCTGEEAVAIAARLWRWTATTCAFRPIASRAF